MLPLLKTTTEEGGSDVRIVTVGLISELSYLQEHPDSLQSHQLPFTHLGWAGVVRGGPAASLLSHAVTPMIGFCCSLDLEYKSYVISPPLTKLRCIHLQVIIVHALYHTSIGITSTRYTADP